MASKTQTGPERAFVKFLVLEGNVTEAYRQTHPVTDLTESQVRTRAFNLGKRADIKRSVEVARAKSAKQLGFTAEDVLREWYDIASADPNELASYQRRCCRHCYGIGFAYQWTSVAEWATAIAKVVDEKPRRGEKQSDLPTMEGGVGYNFTVRPHPECPECRGEGVGTVFIHDTTTLSPKGRKLYAGIHQTSHGVKILMRDQDAALQCIGRAHGLFKDNVAITGPNAGPLLTANLTLPADAVEAAKIYQQLIKRAE